MYKELPFVMFKYAVILSVIMLLFGSKSPAAYTQIPETILPVIAATINTSSIQFYAVTEDTTLELLGELPPDFTFQADSRFEGWMIFEGAVSPDGHYFAFSANNTLYPRTPELFKLFIYHFETNQLREYPLPNIYHLNWIDDGSSLIILPSGEFVSPVLPQGEEPYYIFHAENETFTPVNRSTAGALFFSRSIGSFLITRESPPECEEPCPAYRSELYVINQAAGIQQRLTNLPRLKAPEPFASVEQRGMCFTQLSKIYERIFINACAVDIPPDYFFSVDLNGNVQDENDLRELIGLSDAFAPLEIWQTFERDWDFYMAIFRYGTEEGKDRLYFVRYLYPSGWEIVYVYQGDLLGNQYLREIQMSPDGRLIMIQTTQDSLHPRLYQSNITMIDIEIGQVISRFSYNTLDVYDPVYWLNNERLVFTAFLEDENQNSIQVFDIAENRLLPKTYEQSFALLPIGRSDSLLFPFSVSN